MTSPLLPRLTLPGAAAGRLNYAQVHEDPRLELDALAPAFVGTIAVVSSGGCTALSLRAAGARNVVAIDVNPTQNHLVELKSAACAEFDAATAVAFLGGWRSSSASRTATYQGLRVRLTPGARRYWDGHRHDIQRGVLGTGVSERFIAGIARAVRLLVHGRGRVQRLLASQSMDEQRAIYWREWNTPRWRMLFSLLLGRRSLERTYQSGMFANVEPHSFGKHFHSRFEHTVTRLRVADNYFLHQALSGHYSDASPAALPPYLGGINGTGRMTLVDGGFADYLRTLPAASVSGFALSNICEWLDPAGIDTLFAEIVRTAGVDAVVCFRNFVGWTEVPERWRSQVVEDRARGEALLATDRSLVNRRFAVCRVVPEGE